MITPELPKDLKTDLKTRFSKAQLYLGPSQFATALGLSHFKQTSTLKQELEYGCSNHITPQTKFGCDLEALAIYCYQKRTSRKVIPTKRKRQYHLNHRIGGKCDGLIVDKLDLRFKPIICGLLEIKCHYDRTEPYQHIPTYHLLQVAGYLAIYQAEWCDFMSCCFNSQGEITKFKIFRINWNDVKDPWEITWYPYLLEFLNKVDWQRPKHKYQDIILEIECAK